MDKSSSAKNTSNLDSFFNSDFSDVDSFFLGDKGKTFDTLYPTVIKVPRNELTSVTKSDLQLQTSSELDKFNIDHDEKIDFRTSEGDHNFPHHVIKEETPSKRTRERRGNGMFPRDVFTVINKLSIHKPDIARWSEDGASFVIMDKDKFAKYFYESDFTSGKSFQHIKKQLNNFGFVLQNRYLDNKSEKNRFVYSHEVIRRGAKLEDVREVRSLRSDPKKRARRHQTTTTTTNHASLPTKTNTLSEDNHHITEALENLRHEISVLRETVKTELAVIRDLTQRHNNEYAVRAKSGS